MALESNRLYQTISDRDYPTVQGVLVFFGAIVVSASILNFLTYSNFPKFFNDRK
ncbi:hypothetical protein KBT16_16465 [Nostoc sp. CCCryo 231-06]|nr:hypothetical protein [Nostoc sp. CCCryo 231-06]